MFLQPRRVPSPLVKHPLSDLFSEFDQAFNGAINAFRPSGMPVDIKETPSEFILTADVPGLTKNDVDISLDDDRLTITCRRSESKESENSKYVIQERKQETVSRSFFAPSIEDVDAKLDNGILTVVLKKAESTKRKIAIK